MESKIFPLLFKSGINRDNTSFQGEFINDGDFIRWYSGYMRTMTGMRSFGLRYNLPTQYFNEADNVLQYFYAYPNPIVQNLLSILIINNPQAAPGSSISYATLNLENYNSASFVELNIEGLDFRTTQYTLPQIIAFGANNTKEELLVYLGNNLTNISAIQGDLNQFYVFSIVEDAPTLVRADIRLPEGEPPEFYTAVLSGGVTYASPYLFLYGGAGNILVSSGINPLNFVDTRRKQLSDGNRINIGTDKIIYGTTIRGSEKNYNLIFWTTSSVVLVNSEEPDPNELNTDPDPVRVTQLSWNSTLVSSHTSIMSSRCVVECDGLFYWIGADRFYVYNGMVRDLKNTMNADYFFSNIDMSKRQLVYGILNSKYKEIWWFYPEKRNVANNYNLSPEDAPNGLLSCTRAIIYNLNEQAWYDVALTGTHGQYVTELGKVFNIGLPKNYPPINNYLFQLDTDGVDGAAVGIQPPLAHPFNCNARGAIHSNTSDTADDLGGGDTATLYGGDYLTTFIQTAKGGNVTFKTYDGNRYRFRYIGLLLNSEIPKTYNAINVFGSNGEAEELLAELRNITLYKNQIYWVKLVAGDEVIAFDELRIQNLDNNDVLTFTSLSFWSTVEAEAVVTQSTPIPSYFTTPIMSFASFSPLKENDGQDIFMQIARIEPDVKARARINLSMTINSKTYAQEPFLNSEVFQFTNATPRITTLYQGRQLNFTVSSMNYFEMGNWFFKTQPGAKQ